MRHRNESALSAISITLVGVIACSIVMLASTPGLNSLRLAAHLAPQHAPQHGVQQAVRNGADTPAADVHAPLPPDDRMAEIDQRFQQAVVMLHARRYDEAAVALHRVILLSPRLPEAYVNLGYALLGLERFEAARDFFLTATELQPYQGNAYWGLALAQEQLGDLEGALGAMRIYIHLSPPDDPFVRKARSALWEWDTQLARGPLPEQEKEWIERRTREWTDRNLPDRDSRVPADLLIPVSK